MTKSAFERHVYLICNPFKDQLAKVTNITRFEIKLQPPTKPDVLIPGKVASQSLSSIRRKNKYNVAP